MAVAAENMDVFDAICQRERAPYAVVGEATEERHLTLEDSHFDNTPIDMPMDILLGKPPKMHRDVVTQKAQGQAIDRSGIELEAATHRVLRLPAVAEKTFLITIGDRTVTGLVARDQMVGPWQVPVANCAVTAASYDTYHGEAWQWVSVPLSLCLILLPLPVWRWVKRSRILLRLTLAI